MQPLLSVIIPIYNVEAYLPQCLNSVFSQNVENIEVICINDGSPDRCGDILDDYSNKYDNLIVVNRENGGLIAARNSGYAVAKGKYVYYLDSDDYLMSDVLSRMINFCEDNSLDIALFNGITSLEQKYYTLKNKIDIANGIIHFKNFYLYNSFFPPSVQWLYIYNKEFLDQNNIYFPEDNLQEDEPFTVKVYFHAKNAGLLDIPIIYHRVMRVGSITQKAGMAHLIDARKAWKDLYNYIKAKGCKEKSFYIKIFFLYQNTITKLRHSFKAELKHFFNKDDKKVIKYCAVNLALYKYYFYFKVSLKALEWYESPVRFPIMKKIINKLITAYYLMFVNHE